MIVNISSENFKKIMNDKRLFLPLKWDGKDFVKTLQDLLSYYVERVKNYTEKNECYNRCINFKKLTHINSLIVEAVRKYLEGFPSDAYYCFDNVMNLLSKKPLNKSHINEVLGKYEMQKGHPNLFRVVKVNEIIPQPRERVFHTPYNLRSKVSTSRYSIAGYPSLYLGTSLQLCCEEIRLDPYTDLALTSKFVFNKCCKYEDIEIEVIDLGIKPQDFIPKNNETEIRRTISKQIIANLQTKKSYIYWYPLIAACSFIRTNKNDAFAAEYIIPQLLMQWIRKMMINCDNQHKLIGIRYFSCSSERASDMGFNYVFPTSGKPISSNKLYCSELSKVFLLTSPIYIHEYNNLDECENFLSNDNNLDHIK